MKEWTKLGVCALMLLVKIILMLPFLVIGLTLSLIVTGLVRGHQLHGIYDKLGDKLLE